MSQMKCGMSNQIFRERLWIWNDCTGLGAKTHCFGSADPLDSNDIAEEIHR